MLRQQSKPIQPKFEIDTELANRLYEKEKLYQDAVSESIAES